MNVSDKLFWVCAGSILIVGLVSYGLIRLYDWLFPLA